MESRTLCGDKCKLVEALNDPIQGILKAISSNKKSQHVDIYPTKTEAMRLFSIDKHTVSNTGSFCESGKIYLTLKNIHYTRLFTITIIKFDDAYDLNYSVHFLLVFRLFLVFLVKMVQHFLERLYKPWPCSPNATQITNTRCVLNHLNAYLS